MLYHRQASSPSPIFGSASTFGAGTGFGGFKGATVSSPATGKEADKEAAGGASMWLHAADSRPAHMQPLLCMPVALLHTASAV